MEILEKKADIFKNYLENENSPENIISNQDLAKILQLKGINIKSLGALYSSLTHPYLKNMSLNEMVIRTCKRLIRFDLAKYFCENQGNRDTINFKVMSQVHQNFLDFFNIAVFKNANESQNFWNRLIWPKLESIFEVSISSSEKQDYQISKNYLIELFVSLGLDGDFYGLLIKKKIFVMEDFKEINFLPKCKGVMIPSLECFSFFNTQITKDNELFQKQFYRLFGSEDTFNLKMLMKMVKEGNFNHFNEKHNLPNNAKLRQKLDERMIYFLNCLKMKDAHNALKILDKISEDFNFCFPKQHPFYINLMIQLRNFYLEGGLEEETVFLSKKILAKFEKSLGISACIDLKVYENMLNVFKKFNSSVTEKSYCLEKICSQKQENLKYNVELIYNHLQRGDNAKAIEIFKKFFDMFKEKKLMSKENCADILILNDAFHQVNEKEVSNDCLKLIWSFIVTRKTNPQDFQDILTKYLSNVLGVIFEGLSTESKDILKEFLSALTKNTGNFQIYVDQILNYMTGMNHDKFLEFFNEVLMRILLKRTIDESNEEEEILEAIFYLINRENSDPLFKKSSFIGNMSN